MSIEEKALLVTLQAENAALKAHQAEFAEAEQKRTTAARHAAHVAFAESLVNEGRLLAVSRDVTVAALDLMAAQDVLVEFGEGATKQPLLEAYKATLQASPALVEFGEVAGAGQAMPQGVVNFAAPAGHTVDADALLKLATARAYMDKHHVNFETAITALEG